MEYKTLSSLQNTYPSPRSYKTQEDGSTVIQGIYPQNQLVIPVIDFSELTVIPDTKFRFIVAICDNPTNNSILDLLVSQGLYDDLVKSKNEPNPYFINTLLNPNTFAYIYVDPMSKTFEEQRKLEREIGVVVEFNVIFDENGIADYSRLGKYIDWIISKPELDDLDTEGVIPVKQLTKYTLGRYDQEKGVWGSDEEITRGLKLDDLEDELKSINDTLVEISDFFKNPDPSKLDKDGAIAALLGVGAIALFQSFTATTLTTVVTGFVTREVVTAIGIKTLLPTAVKEITKRTVTGFLGGPVGIAVTVVSILASIFVSRRKRKQQEERNRRLQDYMNKLRSESDRLVQRQEVILKEIEEIKTGEIKAFDGTVIKQETTETQKNNDKENTNSESNVNSPKN